MYNGMYGGYGGQGMGMGGSEMYIVSICCVCCLCIAVLAAGYFTNMFCSVSTSLGKSCAPKQTETPAPAPDPTPEPGVIGPGNVNSCSQAYGKQPRGKNDPRPPLHPEYCKNQTRTLGRDCYWWEVQSDPVTGQARWMRKADPEGDADLKYGGTCTPEVQCANTIDPKTLDRYIENEPQQLLKQCTAISPTATTEVDTIRELTREAKNVTKTWTGTQAWNDTHSRIWYRRVVRFLGQRDVKVHLSNSARAARNLMNKLRTNTLRKATFAYILEAAIRSPDNRADWIIDVVNKFSNATMAPRDRTEAFFCAYLEQAARVKLQDWVNIIDDPRNY